jgi:hypothetical protein
LTTRELYGTGFYSFIAKQSSRKSAEQAHKDVVQEITNSIQEPKTTADLMIAATKTLQM